MDGGIMASSGLDLHWSGYTAVIQGDSRSVLSVSPVLHSTVNLICLVNASKVSSSLLI